MIKLPTLRVGVFNITSGRCIFPYHLSAIIYMLGDNFGAMWPYASVYWYCMAGDALFVAIVTLIARAFRITINEHLAYGFNEELKVMTTYYLYFL